MNEDIVVTAVKDQKVAVYDLKRLVTPGQYSNEVVVYAIINTFVSLPDHRYFVSQYVSSDLKGDSKVLDKYEDEYRMYFDGYDLIVIPLCYNAHWTLAIAILMTEKLSFMIICTINNNQIFFSILAKLSWKKYWYLIFL